MQEQEQRGDALTRSLIDYLDSIGYKHPDNSTQEFKIVLALDNGVVLRGRIVSPDEFLRINSRLSDGHWPDPEADGFGYPFGTDDPKEFVHLADVNYLSGGAWTEGSTARVDIRFVMMAGEKY